ncbi:MAG: tyrosine--tRNA ligase [Oligoflexia bacterium]|nr:tyrosine--tRNA ligase [Oligoflexia bacterium]
MTFFKELEARGIIKQLTDPSLEKLLDRESLTLYCGFDPTADSLHVGSLLPLLTLRRFQLAGHRPIAVVGGATGMIGDPSFKSQERSLLQPEQIQANLVGIRAVIARFLELEEPGGKPRTARHAARILNNGDWFQGLTFIEFLRDIGKHFTVNHMMAKESVRARLEDREHGISYTEFSYMLLQAYDFYLLSEKENCRLQIGGSDQWGNITAGIELARRIRASQDGAPAPELFGMTHPLITKADGTKFGKTEQGTIWLDAKRTTPYQFYQFFVQTADADVLTLLKFLTFLSLERIEELTVSLKATPEKREAQTALARELTRLVHGEEELARAERATQALFGVAIRELDERTLLDVMKDAPSTALSQERLTTGLLLIDALAESGLCASKGAARKEIAAGGVYVNNERLSDTAAALRTEHLIAGGYIVLRRGKKTYHLLSFG